jgi:AcrR family transcriptional regulator
LARIEKGRSKNGETKISISAVAREVGISAALIHNHYPAAAEAIRDAQGRSSRMQRDMKQDDLKDERGKNSDLRKEIKELRAQIAKLASLNEMLHLDNLDLSAKLSSRNILPIPKK